MHLLLCTCHSNAGFYKRGFIQICVASGISILTADFYLSLDKAAQEAKYCNTDKTMWPRLPCHVHPEFSRNFLQS